METANHTVAPIRALLGYLGCHLRCHRFFEQASGIRQTVRCAPPTDTPLCERKASLPPTPSSPATAHLAAAAHAAPGAAAQGGALLVAAGGAGGREEGGHALGIRLHVVVVVHTRDLCGGGGGADTIFLVRARKAAASQRKAAKNTLAQHGLAAASLLHTQPATGSCLLAVLRQLAHSQVPATHNVLLHHVADGQGPAGGTAVASMARLLALQVRGSKIVQVSTACLHC